MSVASPVPDEEDGVRHVGLDVHSEFVQVTEIDEDGRLEHYRLSLDDAGLESLKARLGADTKVVLEASSGTFRLCEELAGAVGELVVANPKQTRGATAYHVKTDLRDSEMLARLLRSGFITPVWIPDGETRTVRGLVEHRMQLGRMKSRLKNGVHGLLSDERIRPPLPSVFTERGLQYLRDLDFSAYSAARMASLVRLYRNVHDEVARVGDELETWSRAQEDAHRLITIPGMSWQLAAAILSQVGDITRFSSPKKLCAYAGLVPRVRQSGKKTSIGGVSLSGPSILRYALFHAVFYARRKPGSVKDFYDRLASNRPKAVARVAAMRKLLTAIWYMLARKQDYRGYDRELVARKLKQRKNRKASKPQA